MHDVDAAGVFRPAAETLGDPPPHSDAVWAAAVFATDPAVLGGVLLSANSSQAVEAWLGLVRHLLPPGSALRRVPGHITDDRLIGGLDLAATLAAGRPLVAHGLLAEANGGVLIVPMAERLSDATAAQVVAASDLREVRIERDGFSTRVAACFGIVAINEGQRDERPPQILVERLALHVSLQEDVAAEFDEFRQRVEQARPQYRDVLVEPQVVEALCTAAVALGIGSMTASWQSVRVAQIAAALSGRTSISEDDVALAARLVLGPRATQHPTSPDAENDQPDDMPSDEAAPPSADASTAELRDVAVDAARATLPPGLLALLAGTAGQCRTSASSRSGRRQKAMRRGRSVGVRRGPPTGGARLNLIETLRAAAPWQRHRRQAHKPDRIEVRGDDFRVRRLRDRVGNTTIFLVDASGSSALHRLAEAKGAVELLLGDCYVRRDQVALIAFGGRGAEILLPPTRSLARARRCLADLLGGGGTPLASGLDAAALMVDVVKSKGHVPGVVVLTDGKANLTRAGSPGRAAAEDEAVLAARAMRKLNVKSVVIDTSPRPQAQALRLADALGARYLPLPHADAQTLSQAVRWPQPGRHL